MMEMMRKEAATAAASTVAGRRGVSGVELSLDEQTHSSRMYVEIGKRLD